ncbi:hypothetical protein [Psychrobacillus vulpis]|uniref:Uncharacterized protein n=1 Tax=Psychrobacillus vulpis TaxID=2325572 RepID=A0A544TWJ1_9BACI|nr:hypothetical protein [Psychrobacillus vulpis]TQR21809.1 hypothetical protein FG384_02365 [Psychrobacillus vulpis]
MMLSETREFDGQLFGLVKFTQYIESLKAGNLYMNNLKFYIDQEKESGIKGVGDKLEASRVYSDMTFKMFDSETGELVAEGLSGGINFRLNRDEKRPVYCMYAVDAEVLEIVREDEDFYYTKFNLPKEEVDNLVNDFGNQMLYINPKPFLERVVPAFEEKYSFKAAKVNYDDYRINNSKRTNVYTDQESTEIYFWKDEFFKNQNEYRLVLTDVESDTPLIENIGDISDISTEFKIDEFFSDKFELQIRKKQG